MWQYILDHCSLAQIMLLLCTLTSHVNASDPLKIFKISKYCATKGGNIIRYIRAMNP